jgi:hypothetical protein
MRCFSSAGSLYLAYVFSQEYPLRGGFPHSDICGSKLVCQLPAAFRRLPRPSSPVIAKASTTCTYSLDPITLSTLIESPFGYSFIQRLVADRLVWMDETTYIQSIKPSRSTLARNPKGNTATPQISYQIDRFTSSRFLKNSRAYFSYRLSLTSKK